MGCWLIFAVTWIVGWIYNLVRSPKIERRRFSPMVLVGAGALWLVSWLIPARVWDAVTVDHWAFRDLGTALLVAGTAFALWARVTMGTMWSGIPAQRAGHVLCTTGPFAITRHPIYAGVLAMLLGTALVYGLGSWLAPVLAAAIGLSLKIRDEEKLMSETFGDEYARYRRRAKV